MLWWYYSTSSVVISKNYFKESDIGVLPDKTDDNTVPQPLQGHRTEDEMKTQWNVFPFKDNYLCHVWMTLSVITFSQINVKLLM